METKRATLQAVIESVVKDPTLTAVEAISAKLDQMIRLMDDQLHLQRISLLEDRHILRFNGPGATRIAFSLPEAQDDYLQRMILRTRTFYEAKQLSAVADMGLVGPKSLICDIGANIGNHTVYFCKVLGAAKVLAFEPQAHCHATLGVNIELNEIEDRAVAYNCLVGAKTGSGQLSRFNARNLGGTVFAAKDDGDVALFALDDVIEAADIARLDLLKIDVEGMQMEVLKGAEAILTERHPAIWVELLPRENSYDGVAAYLAPFGYQPHRLGPNDVIFRV